MISIKYNKTDLRWIFLQGEKQELSLLEAYLNKIPNYMFLPSFSGIPKPEVFLHKIMKDNKLYYYCSAGLWHEIVTFCKENKIEYEGCEKDRYFKYTDFDLSEDDFKKVIASWNMNITPRDYQVHAAWLILKYRFSVSQLATRSGKTLIAYMVFRYMLECMSAKNILMIVPNITLVKQAVSDFDEYGEYFISQQVWAKGEYCKGSNLTVGTFQSLVKRLDKKSKRYDPKFYNTFDVICCDECHTAKCKSIHLILSQNFIRDSKLRFGFTGTLPKRGTIDSFQVLSLLGPCIQDISSKELQDEGYIAKADIKQIKIEYQMDSELKKQYIQCAEYLVSNYVLDNGDKILLPKEQRDFTMQHVKELPFAVKTVKKNSDENTYYNYLIDLCKANGSNLLMLEQMLVHRSKRRLSIIKHLIDGFDGNCIVFAHHTEYINLLEKYFKEYIKDKQTFVIKGSTATKKRAEIQKIMEENDNVILVASYKCASTGITFKNLKYGVFAQSFKSEIINLQSIGRGLLKACDKDTFYIYDIIDCFPTKRLEKHGLAKIRTYKEQNFDYEILKS